MLDKKPILDGLPISSVKTAHAKTGNAADEKSVSCVKTANSVFQATFI